MRVAAVIALVLLSACASDKLALAPPPGVDLSGHWRLNVNDSDDPLHLLQTQTVDPSKTYSGSQEPGGQGGRSGRGNRGGFPANGTGFPGPTTPAVGALNAALRWPGMEVEIKQSAGVVAIISSGVDEVYRPKAGAGKPAHHKPSDDDAASRDMPARDRGPPPSCGWDDKTLVVESGETDDDQPPFEKRYSLSDDGQRLIEIVGFKGGRSGGFTASRVWDRVAPNAPPPPGSPVAPPGLGPSSQ